MTHFLPRQRSSLSVINANADPETAGPPVHFTYLFSKSEFLCDLSHHATRFGKSTLSTPGHHFEPRKRTKASRKARKASTKAPIKRALGITKLLTSHLPPRLAPIVGKKPKTCHLVEERRSNLMKDPFVILGTIKPDSVGCVGCTKTIQLDNRQVIKAHNNHRELTGYYPNLWIKHRDRKCYGIYKLRSDTLAEGCQIKDDLNPYIHSDWTARLIDKRRRKFEKLHPEALISELVRVDGDNAHMDVDPDADASEEANLLIHFAMHVPIESAVMPNADAFNSMKDTAHAAAGAQRPQFPSLHEKEQVAVLLLTTRFAPPLHYIPIN